MQKKASDWYNDGDNYTSCTFWAVKLSNMEQILEPSTKAILCFDFSIAGHLQVAAENFFIVDQWSYSVFFVYNCDQVYQFSMKLLCVGCFLYKNMVHKWNSVAQYQGS